ncbi:uncharacterized protein LOC108596275 isoform X2 [Drosophila busckii]|uniref:uncharacterized protein LOC108596275 isoform X2 n=1 Tax=Drosophila busckii TaxID=30019 RepID=UPI00083F01C8|nr:uncharacterized protein LOC108596275 isoform X2 [Drosophila busckii]
MENPIAKVSDKHLSEHSSAASLVLSPTAVDISLPTAESTSFSRMHNDSRIPRAIQDSQQSGIKTLSDIFKRVSTSSTCIKGNETHSELNKAWSQERTSSKTAIMKSPEYVEWNNASATNLTSSEFALSEASTSSSSLTSNEELEESTNIRSNNSQSESATLEPNFNEEHNLFEHIDLSKEIECCQAYPEYPSIIPKLEFYLRDKNTCDLIVLIGEHKFYCQLCVLQLYSPYFQRCSIPADCNLRLPEQQIKPRIFPLIYNWMLQDTADVRPKQLQNRLLLDFYKAAEFLEIKTLLDDIWQAIGIMDMSETEAYAMLATVRALELLNFEVAIFARISRFFLVLVAAQQFMELSLQDVCRLLNSSSVGVNSEMEIFYSALRWLSHEWPTRQAHVTQLMSCVRFGLLPPLFLRSLQSKQSTQVLHCITQCPLVLEQIEKAFIYASTELYNSGPDQFFGFDVPDFEVPEPRSWIFDKRCAHHHDQHKTFTYQQFLSYLQSLPKRGINCWQSFKYLKESIHCCTASAGTK